MQYTDHLDEEVSAGDCNLFPFIWLAAGLPCDGNDLYVTRRIGLVEALCGFQIKLVHLDSRQILIKHAAGSVIEPGRCVCVCVCVCLCICV